MNEDQEKITFISLGNPNFRLHYAAERQEVYNGQVIIEPAKQIEFIGGKYITSNPEEIKYIRGSIKYRQGMIYEPSKEDRKIFYSQKPVNVRGAVASRDVSDLEPPAPPPLTVKEKKPESEKKPKGEESLIRRCRFCGIKTYTVKEDPYGRKIRMHERACEQKQLRKKRGVK